MRLKILVALLAALLLAAGCGKPQKVGNEGLLDFEAQENAEAIGRAGKETPKPLDIGAATPKPTVKPVQQTERPKATPVFFDVTLTTNSPYYKEGTCFYIAVGVTLRVTNRDNIPERKDGRSFTDKGGTFHSGLLKPGQSWTWVFDRPGTFEIRDEGLTFANARLNVGQGSCK